MGTLLRSEVEFLFFLFFLRKLFIIPERENFITFQIIFRSIHIVNERPQPKYLLLEDYSATNNFCKVNRRSGLDLQHLKLAVESLAKLHAASAVLNCEKSEIFARHHQPNISEYFKVFHSLFINCVKSLIDDTSSSELAAKLNAFERNMIDKSSEAFMLKDNDFGVLCHGDLWLNNLIFSYDDESNPLDVKMVREKKSSATKDYY